MNSTNTTFNTCMGGLGDGEVCEGCVCEGGVCDGGVFEGRMGDGGYMYEGRMGDGGAVEQYHIYIVLQVGLLTTACDKHLDLVKSPTLNHSLACFIQALNVPCKTLSNFHPPS